MYIYQQKDGRGRERERESLHRSNFEIPKNIMERSATKRRRKLSLSEWQAKGGERHRTIGVSLSAQSWSEKREASDVARWRSATTCKPFYGWILKCVVGYGFRGRQAYFIYLVN